jgi:hypothetical protein
VLNCLLEKRREALLDAVEQFGIWRNALRQLFNRKLLQISHFLLHAVKHLMGGRQLAVKDPRELLQDSRLGKNKHLWRLLDFLSGLLICFAR